jgi:hypothetical protein
MNIANIHESQWVNAVEGQVVSILANERVIIRKITGLYTKDLHDLAENLRLRVSVLNPDDGKKYYSVTNPLVNNVEQTGTWRGVSVKYTDGVPNPGRTDSPAGTIIQELRYGWATTLIDTEARLIGGDNIPLQPERFLQRQYVALDFTKLGTIIDGIETTKYVDDPVVETKIYTGRYRILSSKPSKADDGSGIITQTLAKNLVMTPDTLPTAILLTDDKALLSPFAHDTTSVKNSYVWEYRWIDPDYAQTLRNTIALTTGVIDAKVVKVDDGTCSIQVLTQTNTWAGTLSQEWEHQSQYPTFAANRIVNTYSHIALASLAGFKATLGTATAGYKVTSLVDNTDANGGFATIVQTQDKLFVGTVTNANGTTTEEEYLMLLTDGVIRTTLWLGVPDADLSAALTTLATAPSGYTVLRVGHNYSGTGSANIVRTMITKGDSTAEQLRIDFPTFEGERLTYHYFGLDKTTADALYITLQTTCDVGYKVDSVNIIEWRSALAVVQQVSKIMATPTEGLGHDIAKEFEWWGDGEVITKKWLAIKDADLDGALTTLAIAPEGYSVASISHNYNGTGSADVVRVIVKQNITGFESAIQFPTFESERVTNIYLGLDKTAADALYITCQTPPEGYKVDSVTQQQGSRGTITVVQQVSKVQTGTTSAVHQQTYTHAFGLVTRATTVYLNVPVASIDTVKTDILAIADIIVLDITDNDNGQGAANVTYTWRTKESAPRALGAIQSVKPSQFHQESQERLWIDINLDSQTALADAVALALAGTAPYDVSVGDTIQSASGQDAGDKTGNVIQKISKKPAAYTAAEYSMQESFNPHGLQEAVMVVSVREYPEVNYTNVGTIFDSLQTFLGTPAKGRIQVSMNGNGTFSMRGLKEGTPDWDNITPDYVKVAIENPGQIGERKHELATGVPVAAAAAIVADATADDDHALDVIRMTERGNGEATIEKSQTKKDGSAIYVYEAPTWYTRKGIKRTVWLNVAPADLATVWAAAATTNVGDYYVLQYRQKTPLGNGFYNVENAVIDTSDVVNVSTTYNGWLDTKTYISYNHDYSANRDEWRCVKITRVEYRGNDLNVAIANYDSDVCDSDSVYPRLIGLVAGEAIYQSIKITRGYSAWHTTTPTETSAHSTHGPFND